MVRGAYSQWYRLEAAPVLAQVDVRFTAGGAAPFVPLPATELHNRHVSLDALWGGQALEVYERLLEAPTPLAQAKILAKALVTCATLLLAQGVDLRTIMETLGYSQISLTMNTYAHVIPALQQEAASKMDCMLSTAP